MLKALGTTLSPSDQLCFCKCPSPKTNVQCRVTVRVPPGGMGRGQTCPAVKLTMVNQCQVDPGQTRVLHLLRRPCDLGCTREAGFLPALTAFGLLRRDGNKLHLRPLPCLSCCLPQRPSFPISPRGIYCDSKISTKSKAKGSPPPHTLTNTGAHTITPSRHGPWLTHTWRLTHGHNREERTIFSVAHKRR